MMKLLCTAAFTLAITTASFADIYQYSDCDGNGDLLLTELDAEPGVVLVALYLECADLFNANLTDAWVYYADLTNADLERANLTNADVYSTNFTAANLNDANLTDTHYWQFATWTGATYNDGTIFPDGMSPEKYEMIYDPSIYGACCVTSGCDVMEEAMCTNLGGTFTEAGSCNDCVAPPETCAADLDGDGEVKVADLLLLIGAWGVCP